MYISASQEIGLLQPPIVGRVSICICMYAHIYIYKCMYAHTNIYVNTSREVRLLPSPIVGRVVIRLCVTNMYMYTSVNRIYRYILNISVKNGTRN